MGTDKSNLLGSGHPITLDQGIEWTANWRKWSLENGFTPDTILKAFYIPMSDIQALAKNEGGGVRAYFALTDATDPATVKLVLVATESGDLIGRERDVIVPLDTNGRNDDQLYSIYDLTKPCPRFCDIESPLFDSENL